MKNEIIQEYQAQIEGFEPTAIELIKKKYKTYNLLMYSAELKNDTRVNSMYAHICNGIEQCLIVLGVSSNEIKNIENEAWEMVKRYFEISKKKTIKTH